MPDLVAGARAAGAPGPCLPERRASVRYPSSLRGSCQALAARQAEGWTAEIKDVSSGGIGLLLKRRFEPGTVLAVEPLGPGGETVSVLLARVIHARRQPDGTWLLGCRLIANLSEDEVQALR